MTPALEPAPRWVEEKAQQYAEQIARGAGYAPRMIARLRGAVVSGYLNVGHPMRYSNYDRPLRHAWNFGEDLRRSGGAFALAAHMAGYRRKGS